LGGPHRAALIHRARFGSSHRPFKLKSDNLLPPDSLAQPARASVQSGGGCFAQIRRERDCTKLEWFLYQVKGVPSTHQLCMWRRVMIWTYAIGFFITTPYSGGRRHEVAKFFLLKNLRVFVSLCLCAFVSLCLCVFVSLCLCVFVSLCLCVFVSLCLCVFVSLCLCAFVPLCLCAFVPLW